MKGQPMETKPVNMRLSQRTLSRIDMLEKSLQTKNKTQAVAFAVRIASDLLQAMSDGGKIYVERPDGSKERLILSLD